MNAAPISASASPSRLPLSPPLESRPMAAAPTTATTAPGTASRLIGSCSSTPESAATKSGCVHTSAVETNVEAKLSEVIQQV